MSSHLLSDFTLSFLPLFVAIDVIGILPVFLGYTQELNPQEKKTLITHATWTALAISLVFLFAGKIIFSILGIDENDFRIAGGLILLITAIHDMSASSQQPRKPSTFVGVVPIGIPLIMGPAALTTILISVDSYGLPITVCTLLANLLIVWILFQKSTWITKIVGEAGARAFGKVMALFLAAIAIMMIRVGVTGTIQQFVK
ncbi:MAG: MarC family protein [Deltaproteobacteria bacterium]|nr:MarC family protein [Deltaproteobacteria bacterium]